MQDGPGRETSRFQFGLKQGNGLFGVVLFLVLQQPDFV